MTLPVLDYVPRLDERNKAHRMVALELGLEKRSRYWVPGTPVLDQGREGACVGFGVVNEAMASPVRQLWVDPDTPGPWAALNPAQRMASDVYRRAKEIDEWEGVDYDGTSVRAGMLVGRERGWWDGFRWAMNMVELRAALELGPVVIGVEWREGMYKPHKGWLDLNGSAVGGHCLLVTGYRPVHRLPGGYAGPSYRLRNSWGKDWGANGSAYIGANDLDEILFQTGGEAAVPVDRKLVAA